MNIAALAIIAAGVMAFALFSRRLENAPLTSPMLFTAAGLLLGHAGLGLANFEIGHGFVHGLAELTLILVLFSDAARIELTMLGRDHNLPLRLLLIGMPATIVLGTALALALPLGLTLWEAALLAAILAPTDAALGQSVVSSPVVPARIRQALNVESGLNDGIALPLVLVFAACAGAAASGGGGATAVEDWLLFGALQVTLGPATGAAIGWLGASLIDVAVNRRWIAHSFQGPAILATALLAFAAAELIGGNGFIAAFVAGLLFGFRVRGHCRFIFEFAESEGQVLVLLTFLVFGAAILPEALHQLDWAVVLYAVLSLTVVRMLPVAVALSGSGVRPATVLFLGWFGPRGLASILFALFVLERLDTPGAGTVLVVTLVTASLSIVAHGVSAAPLARRYGDLIARVGDCAEMAPVPEMPTRTGMVEPAGAS